jgi:hypothetical protein
MLVKRLLCRSNGGRFGEDKLNCLFAHRRSAPRTALTAVDFDINPENRRDYKRNKSIPEMSPHTAEVVKDVAFYAFLIGIMWVNTRNL